MRSRRTSLAFDPNGLGRLCTKSRIEANNPLLVSGVPERINSGLEREGGVVAQKTLIALRPPRLRRFGGFAKFVDGAATPPHEEGNIRFDLTFCAKPVRAASPMRKAWRGPNSLGLTWGHNELLSDPKHLSCIGSISFSTRFPVGGDRCRGAGPRDPPDSASLVLRSRGRVRHPGD